MMFVSPIDYSAGVIRSVGRVWEMTVSVADVMTKAALRQQMMVFGLAKPLAAAPGEDVAKPAKSPGSRAVRRKTAKVAHLRAKA